MATPPNDFSAIPFGIPDPGPAVDPDTGIPFGIPATTQEEPAGADQPWLGSEGIIARSYGAGTAGLALSGAELAAKFRENAGALHPRNYATPEQIEEIKARGIDPMGTAPAFWDEVLTPEQKARRWADIEADPEIKQYRATSKRLAGVIESRMPEVARSDPWSLKGVAAHTIASGTRMIPALAAGALGGGPAVTLGIMGADVFGHSLKEGRDMGLDPDRASQRAVLQAAAEAIPESLPVAGMLGKLAGGPFRNWMIATFGEGAQEVLTEALQTGMDKGWYDEDASAKKALEFFGSLEGLEQLAYAGVIGHAMGATLGFPAYLEAKVNPKKREAERLRREIEEVRKRMDLPKTLRELEREAQSIVDRAAEQDIDERTGEPSLAQELDDQQRQGLEQQLAAAQGQNVAAAEDLLGEDVQAVRAAAQADTGALIDKPGPIDPEQDVQAYQERLESIAAQYGQAGVTVYQDEQEKLLAEAKVPRGTQGEPPAEPPGPTETAQEAARGTAANPEVRVARDTAKAAARSPEERNEIMDVDEALSTGEINNEQAIERFRRIGQFQAPDAPVQTPERPEPDQGAADQAEPSDEQLENVRLSARYFARKDRRKEDYQPHLEEIEQIDRALAAGEISRSQAIDRYRQVARPPDFPRVREPTESQMREVRLGLEAQDLREQRRKKRAMDDPRLKREEYRGGIQSLVDNLIPGGGVAYLRDARGDIVERTGSGNPEWFKRLEGNERFSVKEARRAVAKVLAGEPVAGRQEDIVRHLLDVWGSERQGPPNMEGVPKGVVQARERLALARQKRRMKAGEPEPPPPEVDAFYETLAEVYEETEYQGLDSFEERSLFDLAEELETQGWAPEEVDAELRRRAEAERRERLLEERLDRAWNKTEQSTLESFEALLEKAHGRRQQEPEAGGAPDALREGAGQAPAEPPGRAQAGAAAEGGRLADLEARLAASGGAPAQRDPGTVGETERPELDLQAQQGPPPTPPVSPRQPEPDLFGQDMTEANALAAERRRLEERRNQGETDMTGTLFGQDRQQVDLEDQVGRPRQPGEEEPQFSLEQAPVQGPRLSALHNLTSENLIAADRMGGLPVPSVAVVTDEMGMEGYGDITLIGGRDLADPTKNEVYDADAYSSTFPSPEYPKARSAEVQAVLDDLRPYAERFGERSLLDQLWDPLINTRGGPNPAEAIQALENSLAGPAQFLAETTGANKRPVMEARPPQNEFSYEPEVREFFAQADLEVQDLPFDHPKRQQQMKDAAEALREAIRRIYGPKARRIMNTMLSNDRFFTSDGALNFATFDAMRNDQHHFGERQVNKFETRERLERAMSAKQKAAFHDWATEKIMGLMGEPFLRIGRRKAPYTLKNIVGYMTRRGLRAQEDLLTFSDGMARAVAARRFTNLELMREQAATALGSETEIAEAREAAKSLLSDFRSAVADYYTGRDWRGETDTWNALDNAMKSLAAWAKTKRRGAGSLRAALNKNGFKDVPDQVIDLGLRAGQAMMLAPVPYFESKPARAVALDEFVGAAVPDGVSPEVLAVLDKHGITWRKYGQPFDEKARAETVKALRESLQRQNPDVLFSMEVSPLGFYSALSRAAAGLPQERGTPSQMLGLLKKQKGVKDEEIQWTGLEEYLSVLDANGQKVTKAQIQEFLDNNGVQVEETVLREEQDDDVPVVLEEDVYFGSWGDTQEDGSERQDIRLTGAAGGGQALPYEAVRKDLDVEHEDGDWRYLIVRAGTDEVVEDLGRLFDDGEVEERYMDRLEADGVIRVEGDIETDLAKYQEHTEPGGENYREILFSVPAALDDRYMEGHYQVPGRNVIGHARAKDRKGPNGEKLLYAEEFQSDLHQKGRKEGYRRVRSQAEQAELDSLNEGFEDLQREAHTLVTERLDGLGYPSNRMAMDAILAYPDWKERFYVLGEGESRLMPAEARLIDEWREKKIRIDELMEPETYDPDGQQDESALPPDTPFKGSAWTELILKRLIRLAAEGGYDAVVWTTGDQQAERYNLAKVLDQIIVNREEAVVVSGVARVDLVYRERQNGQDSETLMVDTARNGKIVVGRDEFEGKTLEEVVGAAMAEDILSTAVGDERVIQGNDLAVGGQGMKGFYDRTVPNIAKKVARRLDKKAQVFRFRAPLPAQGNAGEFVIQELGNTGRWHVGRQGDDGFRALELGQTYTKDRAEFIARLLGSGMIETERYVMEVHEKGPNTGRREFWVVDTADGSIVQAAAGNAGGDLQRYAEAKNAEHIREQMNDLLALEGAHVLPITPTMRRVAVDEGLSLFALRTPMADRQGAPGAPERAYSGLTAQQVDEAVRGAYEGVSAATGLQVEIIHSEMLPPEVAAKIPPGKVAKSLVIGRTVYLLHDQLRGPRDAQVAFAHEVVGHFGLNNVLGPEGWAEVLEGYRQLKAQDDPRFADIYKEFEPGGRYGHLQNEETEVREFIALAAERRETQGPVGRLMRQVREALRRWLKALGFGRPFSMTDIDLLLSASEKFLQTGRVSDTGIPVGAGDSRVVRYNRAHEVRDADEDQGGPTGEARGEGVGRNLRSTALIPRSARKGALQEIYHQRVENTEVLTLQTTRDRVESPEDAAELLAGLADRAQENLLAVVLDQEGRVLEVQRHSLGQTDSAPVSPMLLAGAILSVEGAKRVVLAHNHPAGVAGQSGSDMRATTDISTLLSDTGVEVEGMLVVAGGGREASFEVPAGADKSWRRPTFNMPGPSGEPRDLGITERLFTPGRDQQLTIRTSEDAIDYLAGQGLEDGQGVLFLDGRHHPVAFIPMSPREMNNLRPGAGRSPKANLLRAMHWANSKAAMVVAGPGIPRGHTRNLLHFLNSMGGQAFRVLDVLEVGPEGRRSVVADDPNFPVDAMDVYFSLEDQYTPEVVEILRRISAMYQPVRRFRQRFEEIMQNKRLRIRQYWADPYASIRQILGATDSWKIGHLAKGSWGAVEASIKYGQPVFHKSGVIQQDTTKRGLTEILAPLGIDLDRFLFWIAANRAERLKAEDRENLFQDLDIQVLKQLNKSGEQGQPGYRPGREQLFQDVLEEFEEFQAAWVQVAVDTGLIDPKEAEVWKEQGFYLPFYRVLNEEPDSAGPRTLGNDGLVGQDAFKRLKGRDSPLNDLLGNALLNWDHLAGAAMKNLSARKALDAAVQMGLFKKVSAKHHSKDAVYVRVDGQRVWYEPDGSNEAGLVLDSLKALNWNGLNTRTMKVARLFKRTFTTGVTVNPEFKIANLIRDTLQAVAVSQEIGLNVPKNLYDGWKATAADSPELPQMLSAGAIFPQSGYIHGADPDAVRYLVRGQVERDTILDSRWRIKKAWDAYQDFGARLENVNRAAMWAQQADGLSPMERAFAARDLLDFSRHGAGSIARFLAQTVPFLNARVQGLDKMARAGAEPGRRARFYSVIGAYAVASVIQYLLMRDDEDYKQVEEWERDTYHLFKIPGSDVMFRLPRPFEVGAIASLAERFVEQLVDDEVHGQLFAERLWFTLMQTFSFNPFPQLVWPAMEVWANKNTFTDRPIESMSMKNLPPAERKRAWTSETAIALSAGMDKISWGKVVLSPVQIEHLVQGYLGWLGAVSLGAADMLITRPLVDAPTRPTPRITDYPVIKRFAKVGPRRNTKYTTMFYESLEELNMKWAAIGQARELRDMEKARKLLEEGGDELKLRKFYNAQAKKLSEINKRMTLLQLDREMSAQEKARERDRLQVMKNAITENAHRRKEALRAEIKRAQAGEARRGG